jgi:hypothetical protein
MEKAWKGNTSNAFSRIEVIDIKEERELRETWKQFASSQFHTAETIWDSYLFTHPRRSCEHWEEATLQQNPQKDNKFPIFPTLSSLHQWIKPLIEEEKR